MSKRPNPPSENDASNLADQVGQKAVRKLRARSSEQGVWFGLGMMGLVGWSVSVPTLIGVAIGMWIDARHPSGHSWTLALLVGGLTLGCFNAWHWVSQESQVEDEAPNE